MLPSQGFWSYAHADDEIEGGRIQKLARDIVNQYRLLTGEVIELLFLDKDTLKAGDQWRKEIEFRIGSVAFFYTRHYSQLFFKS